MKKYTLLAALAFSALTVTATPKENTSQGNPQEMDKFITELMGKMTLHEKIGQLNLPVTGNIVTGQAKSSDVAGKSRNCEVGGLFNLKGGKMQYLEASVGASFPIRYSYLSLGATWRKQLNTRSNLMQESRFSLNLNLTFGERISRAKLK